MSARRLASLVAWAPLAAGVAAGATVFLAACGDPAPRAPAAPPPTQGGPVAIAPPPAAPGAPGKDPKRPAFLSSAECGSCHVEIYEEWKASWHGQAMTDPLFLEISNNLQQEECIRCHAPVPLRETENWETPVARTDRREDAISCLTCHQSGGNVSGPHEGLSGPCRPVYDPDQTDVTKVCFACHNQHKTGEEWLAGPYAPDAPAPRQVEARTCIECHMPVVERPLVQGGQVRRGRRHTWPGGHSMDQLKKAATLEAETSVVDGALHVRTWVKNAGAGHNIPTDARHRSFDVYVKLWDADGNVVLDPLDPVQQAKSQTAKYRLNYRNSNIVDTQVPPLARVSGLGAWKGEIRVPGLTKGRGEAWLVYRLTPGDVLMPESLSDPEFVAKRARRVITTPFEFGR